MVALYALKTLKLDWVWWLVSPQNPLKDPSIIDEYGKRLAYTRRIAKHPRFIVTDIEKQMQTRYTEETLETHQTACTRVATRNSSGSWAPTVLVRCIVGITGSTSPTWCQWQCWRDPVIPSRPCAASCGHTLCVASCFSAFIGGDAKTPAWTFITMPLRKESSTAIRKRRKTTA